MGPKNSAAVVSALLSQAAEASELCPSELASVLCGQHGTKRCLAYAVIPFTIRVVAASF